MSEIERKQPHLRPLTSPFQSPAAQMHACKENTANIRPLGEVSVKKIKRLFNQQVETPIFWGKPKDPDPGPMRYRLRRLWLTPSYWTLLRCGLPVILLIAMLGFGFFNAALRARLQTAVSSAQDALYSREEHQIHRLKVKGATAELARDIRTELNLKLPLSAFAVDLPALEEQIERMDSVKSARLSLRHNHILELAIQSREAVVLWRKGTILELLDLDGVRAGVVQSRFDRPDLPVIVGMSVEDHIAQAIELFKALEPLQNRVRGLRRVGERRWDVMLDRAQIIQLPEAGPKAALDAFLTLNAAQNILQRDIERVDLRDPNRLFVQLSPYATQILKRPNHSTNGKL